MTIKGIMTHVELASSPQDLKHLAYALALMETFGAHLTALVFATEVKEFVVGYAEGDGVRRDASVTSQIQDAAAKRGVACEARRRSGFADVFSDHAKLCDLSVIS